MSSDDHLYDLVAEWDQRRQNGEELSAEVLCKDCPELIPAIKERIASVKATDWLLEVDNESDESLSLPPFLVPESSFSVPDSISFDDFSSSLVASKLLTTEELKRVEATDASSLATNLIRTKKLTPYQAQQICEGNSQKLILGNYVILDKLGAGGMGEVFKARHRRMDRLVALKVLPKKSLESPTAVERFHREVKAAARLEHPNIVTAHDADEFDGSHFLVMQYVEGHDLAMLVKANGPMSVGRAVHCIIQAAKGLEFAHAEGIIHRDIKPANLLLDKKGTVKILDMGLARLENSDGTDGFAATQAQLTQDGVVMGTVDYMSPEQAMDTRHADGKADIYSLGCTFYYLLTGEAVYGGNTLLAKMLGHREGEIPSLLTARTDVPEKLNSIYTKMVAKNPADRYPTMTTLLDDLRAIEAEFGETWQAAEAASKSSVIADQSVSLAARETSSSNVGETLPTLPRVLPQPATPQASPKIVTAQKESGNKWRLAALVGAALLGVVSVAGVIISLQTKDGTLIVEVDQPDAIVQVLDVAGTVKITQQGEQGTISLSVDPGKHRLKIEKDGFKFFAENFELEAGGKKTITAKLIPLDKKPVVGTKPASGDVVKKPLFFQTPAFDPWAKEVAAMPAEKQVEAVSKKLVELNPGFDGKVTHTVANGKVAMFLFAAEDVTDISPVRALTHLTKLSCGNGFSKSQISDLSPLKGMRLTYLDCSGTKIADLSSLKGIPLTDLLCSHTEVADLSPLQEMPLKGLNCSFTNVADLSPLKGILLMGLNCGYTQVSDLSPLQGMPLKNLSCDSTQVSDLKPLKGMSLIDLHCINTQVSDLTPLQGMPLTTLHCNNMQVSDLTPLQGMPLFHLNCSHTQVADLSPLKGMPLRILFCSDTKASDLSPLKGMPLTVLGINDTMVSDLTPLRGMPLTKLLFTNSPTFDISLLKEIETLNNINGNPAAEFWKEVEEQQKGKKLGFQMPDFDQWIKDVQVMTAEEQLEAVSKKLVELNPGFDGKVTGFVSDRTPEIEDGVVTDFGFLTINVRDISPVRALKGLRSLNCSGSNYDELGVLSDLSPLKGLQIKFLNCFYTQVADLTPLQEMSLGTLNCHTTQVTDLSPLKNMSIFWLNLSETNVADLTPLKNMPLTFLDCFGTKISDLSPLKGMPLEELRIATTLASDYSPLSDMPLKDVTLDFKLERDTALLRSIKTLEKINGKPVAEFWKEVDGKQNSKVK